MALSRSPPSFQHIQELHGSEPSLLFFKVDFSHSSFLACEPKISHPTVLSLNPLLPSADPAHALHAHTIYVSATCTLLPKRLQLDLCQHGEPGSLLSVPTSPGAQETSSS